METVNQQIKLNITGSPHGLIGEMNRLVEDDMGMLLERVRGRVEFTKRQISEYQGALLIALGRQYNFSGASILEIGTAWGYSAACLAEGAFLADITTINPKVSEIQKAKEHLRLYPNVEIVLSTSEAYRYKTKTHNLTYDFIFVDGDHDNVRDDFRYWRYLRPGGLMLFHDYSPDKSWRPCRVVYEAVNELAEKLERHKPDILYFDDRGAGMAGFYK